VYVLVRLPFTVLYDIKMPKGACASRARERLKSKETDKMYSKHLTVKSIFGQATSFQYLRSQKLDVFMK